jgi:hypothetical protein
VGGFLKTLNMDVSPVQSKLFYERDIAFITSTGGITTLTGDYGKLSMAKLVAMKQASMLIIHESLSDSFGTEIKVTLGDYPSRILLVGVSSYALYRRFSVLMSICCSAMDWTLGKEMNLPMTCQVQPGESKKFDPIVEFKTQVNIPEFKSYFLKSHEVFDWQTAILALMKLNVFIDFRVSSLTTGFTPDNLKAVLFPVKEDDDPVVAVHNLMKNTFENKLFLSMEKFEYPLREKKVMSSKSKSNYLRNQFRNYSDDEKKCIVYIPSTICYGEGEGSTKSQALLSACKDFLQYYQICTIEELNESLRVCPRCNGEHYIQSCLL